jgi:DNA-binding HxlR family transcriptional regulator
MNDLAHRAHGKTFAEIRRLYPNENERILDQELQKLRRHGRLCFDRATRRWRMKGRA